MAARAGGRVRRRFELAGMVQGVGLRPHVWRLADAEGLAGSVRNSGGGAVIEVEGPAAAVARFATRLRRDLPPGASVQRCVTTEQPPRGEVGFRALASAADGAGALAPPDRATCPACLREIRDPADRRYRHPFATCLDCGPRYSIIAALPYDRAATTMADFALCPACRLEYADPAHRRFHAETIACPACGPRLALWDAAGAPAAGGDAALRGAADLLRDGRILAVKGLGGFQLLADAGAEAAVARLRQRKRRPRKPFAVMAGSLEMAARLARIGPAERKLLCAAEAPIVLLARIAGLVAAAVAPGLARLGVMLPSTPLHHLLLADLGRAVVATSGNVAGAPIVADEHDAVRQLAGIADAFLVHNRRIVHPVDNSVAQVMAGQAVVLRRARGYAPLPLAVDAAPDVRVLALGGQQKSAIALGSGGTVILGPHIADLDTAPARAALAHAADALPRLFGMTPTRIACDSHPDYHTSHVAAASGLPVVRVPHHLAHVLGCMLDNGVAAPVLGVAWDGTGHGGDGTVWGGEFLLVGNGSYRRLAHLAPFRLPGGDAAVREPRRAALGVLHALGGDATAGADRLAPVLAFSPAERRVLRAMLARGVNAPWTSSAGRLFDAVAALLGLCQVNGFEAEAAMALEAIAGGVRPRKLPVPVLRRDADPWVLDWRPTVAALLAGQARGVTPAALAAGLHASLADAIAAVAVAAGIRSVVLTGGCFQNACLTAQTVARLRRCGHIPFWHRRVPPNDGGLAAGQAVFAARPLVEEMR